MLSTEQESLNLEFALSLRKKQFACIQNIIDERYVMGILPTGYGETLICTILPRVLYMLPGNIGWHTLTWCCLLFTVGHRKKDYSRSMGLGLGAVHPKLSGSTIDTGKPLY